MTKLIRAALTLAFTIALTACAGTSPSGPSLMGLPAAAPLSASGTRWVPTVGSTYQIQYDGNLNLKIPADIYDLDMFDTPASIVAKLHAQGRHAVCYIDVGTWENWRPDAKKFPKRVLGKPDGGWPGERWLDIRQTRVLEPIMSARMQLCRRKGFDAVDPDNIDGYENDTGFPLTGGEQLTYDTWVAQEAHALGLSVAQKNDNDQVNDLVNDFDFAVLEQCYTQGWCKQFSLYTKTDRLVVDVEYTISQARFTEKACPVATKYDETAILKKLQLTAWIVTCPVSAARAR
jgi:hypothetical protein